MKSHKTYQPCGGDEPRDRVSGRWGGPTAAFWPTLVTLRGYIFGTGRGNTHGPRQVVQDLQHVEENCNRYREQHQWLEWVHHLESATLIKLEWAHTERATWFRDSMRGADWWRDITWGNLTTRGDSRGYPPWVHFFGWDPKSWREAGFGPRNQWIRGTERRDPISCLALSTWTAEG